MPLLQECLEKCGESLQEIINYHMVSQAAPPPPATQHTLSYRAENVAADVSAEIWCWRSSCVWTLTPGGSAYTVNSAPVSLMLMPDHHLSNGTINDHPDWFHQIKSIFGFFFMKVINTLLNSFLNCCNTFQNLFLIFATPMFSRYLLAECPISSAGTKAVFYWPWLLTQSEHW